METQFICSECGCEHNEPAGAVLGHRVLCLDCDLMFDVEAAAAQAAARKPRAASLMSEIPPLAA